MGFRDYLSSFLSTDKIVDNVGKEAASRAGAIAQGTNPASGVVAAAGEHADASFINAKGYSNYAFTVLIIGGLAAYIAYLYFKKEGIEKASSSSKIQPDNSNIGNSKLTARDYYENSFNHANHIFAPGSVNANAHGKGSKAIAGGAGSTIYSH